MQIYRTDLNKLAILLLPPRLRSASLLALLKAFVAPITAISASFTQYRNETDQFLGITPQVCYLEKILNDRFDIQRRIYIENTSGYNILLIHTDEKAEPILLHTQESGAAPVLIHDISAYADAGYDFYVYVPTDLNLTGTREYEVRAIVEKKKLADKRFKIIHKPIIANLIT